MIEKSPRAESFLATAAIIAREPSFAHETALIMVEAEQEALTPDQVRLAFGDADRRHRKALKVSQLVLDAAYPLAAEAAEAAAEALREEQAAQAPAEVVSIGHTLQVADAFRGNSPLRLVSGRGEEVA